MIHGRHVREEQINSRQRTELAIRWQQPAQPQFVTPERHLDGRSYGVHFWVVKWGAELHTQLAPPQAPNPPTPSLPLLTYHWLGGRIHRQPACACGGHQSASGWQVMGKIRLLESSDLDLSASESSSLLSGAAPRPGDGRLSGSHTVVR